MWAGSARERAVSCGRSFELSIPTNIYGCYLRRENSTSVAIEMKKGPVLPGSKVAGIMVKMSSSELFSNMNPSGVDTSWVGTIGDPSYGRPWANGKAMWEKN